MSFLYHGSAAAGIGALEPRSKPHGSERRVVHLSDNLPRAPFYIWDGARIGYGEKRVNAIKNLGNHIPQVFAAYLLFEPVRCFAAAVKRSCLQKFPQRA